LSSASVSVRQGGVINILSKIQDPGDKKRQELTL
jgi:hypothetical protein